MKSTKDAVFYDPKTIGVYENYRKVWLLFNFAKPLDVGSEQGQSKTGYYKVDCKSQKYSMVAELISSQPGGEGKILQRTQVEEDKWSSYANDDVWKSVTDAVCTRWETTYQSTKGPALDEKQALQKLRCFQGVVKTLPMAKTCLLHALAAIFLSCSITGL